MIKNIKEGIMTKLIIVNNLIGQLKKYKPSRGPTEFGSSSSERFAQLFWTKPL